MNDKLKEGTILITGANGQIGSALVSALQNSYGEDKIIATDIREPKNFEGRFEVLDVLDYDNLDKFIERNKVKQIYHLAALLSSKGEENPEFTWQLNFDAYLNILRKSVNHKIDRVFFPSTIGIFGKTTPKQATPQNASFEPSTVYGISKYSAELWSQYFRQRYGLDIRGVRYPGVISYETRPVGGTTDFAVEMFFEAIEKAFYECYLKPDTRLPMLYMPDVLKGTIDLMHAPKESISTSMAYNISGFSLTPNELYIEIKKHIPNFRIEYNVDHRQAIADSWTETIDDSVAKKDWNWQPEYNMSSMASDMIENIK